MRTRLARPRPLQLVVSGSVFVLGIAGACSAGTPDAPAVQREAVEPPPATPSVASRDSSDAKQIAGAGVLRDPDAMRAGSAGSPSAPAAPRAPVAQRQAAEPPATSQSVSSEGDGGAKQIPGTGMLRYPDAMRSANREGEVHAMFVVDERGLVDTSSFRVVESTDPAFTAAVRAALPTLRFRPARKGGRAVRQVVEQPFTFALSGN